MRPDVCLKIEMLVWKGRVNRRDVYLGVKTYDGLVSFREGISGEGKLTGEMGVAEKSRIVAETT